MTEVRCGRHVAGTCAGTGTECSPRQAETRFVRGGIVYRVTDRDGRVLKPGDTVTDFRGNPATLLSVSRGPEYNGTAKVVTRRPSGWSPENYAQVFDLTVTPVS